MKQPKRHDFNSEWGYGEVAECEDGDYVEYSDYLALKEKHREISKCLEDLLGCPANIVQASVPRAGIAAAPPYQVVLDVSVALTRWNKAKYCLKSLEEGSEKEETKQEGEDSKKFSSKTST